MHPFFPLQHIFLYSPCFILFFHLSFCILFFHELFCVYSSADIEAISNVLEAEEKQETTNS